MIITALTTASDTQLKDLSRMLVACVQTGATVGFLRTLSEAAAGEYWRGALDGARASRLVLLVASTQEQEIVGTAQLSIYFPPNQPHVAGLSMLLVHPTYRRRGIAGALLKTTEIIAPRLGRTLLILQTTAGSDAERLYGNHGYNRTGILAGFVLDPDGCPQDGVFCCKLLKS